MVYETIVQEAPPELQLPMIRIVEAIEQDFRNEFAVRREDIARVEVSIAGVAEAQHHGEQRVSRLEAALAELAASQKGAEQRMARLETALAGLAEAQKRTEQRVEELTEAQKRTEQRVEELTEAQKTLTLQIAVLTERVDKIDIRLRKVEIRLDHLVGDHLEARYSRNAHSFVGRLLRNIKVVGSQELEERYLEAHLTEDELVDASLLDLRLGGRLRAHPNTPEVWLAVEVSAVVDLNDVERARRRAGLLRKAGLHVIPTVAGGEITGDAEEAAAAVGVFVLQNGRRANWDQAVAAVLEEI